MPKMKLVYIEWEDARSSDGWHDKDEIDEHIDKSTMVQQTGWVWKETSKYIALVNRISQHHWNNDDSEAYGNIIKIPKTWIRKRKTFNV